MNVLTEKTCSACRGETAPLQPDQVAGLLEYAPGWEGVEGRKLSRRFKFPDFARALAFVNRVGELAEREGHHPDIHLAWGKAVVELTTHKLNGLSESDFVMAAKINDLPTE